MDNQVSINEGAMILYANLINDNLIFIYENLINDNLIFRNDQSRLLE